MACAWWHVLHLCCVCVTWHVTSNAMPWCSRPNFLDELALKRLLCRLSLSAQWNEVLWRNWQNLLSITRFRSIVVFFFMYLTITGVKRIVRYTEDFTCRGSLYRGSTVINIMHMAVVNLWNLKEAVHQERGGSAVDFYSLACNSRFLYNRETLEIKDPRKNKTGLIYCLFCFVCLFVRFVCLFI